MKYTYLAFTEIKVKCFLFLYNAWAFSHRKKQKQAILEHTNNFDAKLFLTSFLFCMFVDCMYYVLRAPRKIGAKPIGLPSLNKVFTYLLTYLLT